MGEREGFEREGLFAALLHYCTGGEGWQGIER